MIKQVERSILQGLDWSQNAQNENQKVLHWARSLKRPSARLRDQAPKACRDCTLAARLSVHLSAQHNFSQGPTLFHQKTQILISQHPNSFPKVVYRSTYSKGLSKTHQTWNQIPFQHNSSNQPIFIKTFDNHSIHATNSKLWTPKVQIIDNNISQQQQLILNLSTTNHNQHHSLSNLSKTQSITIYRFQACKFNIIDTIIIKFTYLNIASNISTNFTNWIHNNHFSQISTFAKN